MQFDQVQLTFTTPGGNDVAGQVPLHAVRGLFLHVISEADTELATSAHDSLETSRYAIQVQVKGCFINVMLNLFDNQLVAAMGEYFIKMTNARFNIGKIDALLKEIRVTSIDIDKMLRERRLVRKFKVVFKTPAYLKASNGIKVYYPEPRHLFKNLARLWNDFTGTLAPVDAERLAEWAGDHVEVTSHELQTVSVPMGSGKKDIVGFKGWTMFAVNGSGDDPDFVPIIDMLLTFGMYSNVGGSRSACLGSILYQPIDVEEKT
nr:CRISPR system precrRNA processing endoribonuclease RAMP protein Cas6 [Candidatus Sigynarchaeota archaeon]